MRLGWFVLSLCVAFAAQAEDVLDNPPQGEREDYANYYIETKRDGLEPFWKASVSMPKHQKQFVLNYRDVRLKKDAELLETILHPASKACENEMRKPYFESIREFYLTEEFPESFDIKFFPIPQEKRWPLKERLEFPVSPTHIMYIEYKNGEYVEGLQRFVREEQYPEPRFYELVKCPSEASMQAMVADAERRLAEEEKAGN